MSRSFKLSLLGLLTLALTALKLLGVVDVSWECVGGLCCLSFLLPIGVIGVIVVTRGVRKR